MGISFTIFLLHRRGLFKDPIDGLAGSPPSTGGLLGSSIPQVVVVVDVVVVVVVVVVYYCCCLLFFLLLVRDGYLAGNSFARYGSSKSNIFVL